MGEDPQQLEREIEKTRVKLGEDIDALEEKVNPKKVAHRSVDRAKEKVAGVRDKVVDAAGTAKDKVTDAAGTAKDKVTDAAGGAKDKVTDAADTARDKVSSDSDPVVPGESGPGIGEKVSGLVGTARDKAGPLAATAKDRVAPLAATAKDKVAPLAATAKDKVAPLAATAKDKVAPLAATAKDKAAERVGMDPRTADTREVATAVAGGTWSTLLEQTRRNPALVGGVAFALGLVLGHR